MAHAFPLRNVVGFLVLLCSPVVASRGPPVLRVIGGGSMRVHR